MTCIIIGLAISYILLTAVVMLPLSQDFTFWESFFIANVVWLFSVVLVGAIFLIIEQPF